MKRTVESHRTPVSPAPETPTETYATTRPTVEWSLDPLGLSVVPLRKAVDMAIAEIDGIVEECRTAMDRACAMHTYAAGKEGEHCGGWNGDEEDVAQEFNEAMAEAAGALKCLLGYVNNLKPGAIARRGLSVPSTAAELSHAAEE